MRTLIWFRADLRTNDNTALTHAVNQAIATANESEHKGTVAVFTVCPTQWLDEHDWADIKVDLIRRTLETLSKDLAKLNIPLKFITIDTFAEVPAALLDLAQQHNCTSLHFNAEYEWNERLRDEAVADLLSQHDIQTHAHTDQTLYEPGTVRTGSNGYYTIYSPFKRNCYARWKDGDQPQLLPAPSRAPTTNITPDPVPASVPKFTAEPRWAELWDAGEHNALKRLSAFIAKKLHPYKDERDTPSIDATSVISPYLAIGAVSPRQCVHAAADANHGHIHKGNAGAVHWISEVLWREFYKHILVGFPRVNKHRAFQLHTERIRWSDNDDHFQAWCEGRTGVPIVDAGMRQLNHTGWMHNRLRMITAMYLTKNLFADWRKGERYFMRHLVDGDLASNNGGWQWSASTGTDAAPYFRIMNPYSQSKRNDPDGAFIRQWIPELADLTGNAIHEPHTLAESNASALFNQLDYPEPIVDHATTREHAIEVFKRLKKD